VTFFLLPTAYAVVEQRVVAPAPKPPSRRAAEPSL